MCKHTKSIYLFVKYLNVGYKYKKKQTKNYNVLIYKEKLIVTQWPNLS